MKPIGVIVRELDSIPRALSPPHPNPYQKPLGRLSELPGQLQDVGVLLQLPDGWEYPAWVEQETWRPIDEAAAGKAVAGNPRVGIDALAWYVSFHHSPGEWGIFVPVSRLAYFEFRVLTGLPLNREAKWRLGLLVLLAHERMHFALDYVCAQWELLLQVPSWAALNHRLRTEQLAYFALEEQLANAYMLRRGHSFLSRAVEERIRWWVANRQPPGYRDGVMAVDDASFGRVFTEVVKSYVGIHAVERGLDICADSYEHGRLLPPPAEIESDACPIHLIHDERRVGIPEGALRLVTSMSRIVETDSFRRQRERMARSIQKKWEWMKGQLANGIPRSARFEKLKAAGGEVFSVRLNNSVRVHLRFSEGQDWEAIAVGSHTEMGHG